MWLGGYSFEHSSAPESDSMDSSQQIHQGQEEEEEAIDPSFLHKGSRSSERVRVRV